MGNIIKKLVVGVVVGGILFGATNALGFPFVFQALFFGYAMLGAVVFMILDFPTLKPFGGVKAVGALLIFYAILSVVYIAGASMWPQYDPEDEKGKIEKILKPKREHYEAGKVEAVRAAAARGVILAEATNLARDLSNEPSNHLTPSDLAAKAADVAKENGLELEVLERADMEAKGMGSLLSVAKGSAQPPKLVRLSYKGRGGEGYDLALVGKGITFDTGGISIKPAANMEAMKADMTGAASVIAAMGAIAKLAPKVNVVAIAPCTENMPGGNATKPGDVVSAMNGRTIEIVNTDAEGRLVLADALCWAKELGAQNIIDVATLTGAVTTALGDVAYGLMTNNDAFCAKLEAAAAEAHADQQHAEDVPDEDVVQIRRLERVVVIPPIREHRQIAAANRQKPA